MGFASDAQALRLDCIAQLKYRVISLVQETPTFYRVHFAPKSTDGSELGGVTSKGAEVMYIFDKKTLDFKCAFGAS